jgi:cytoskeletal protein CcmA (bactofilin family)
LSPTAIVNGEIVADTIQVDFGAQVEGRLTAKGKSKN